ncbi:MAG: nucleotide exchange factor GrpE [Verrucomicrobiales bacterium]|nr:nucleotide exchange factor GrpE [Verrucomicrobiales bacterium]
MNDEADKTEVMDESGHEPVAVARSGDNPDGVPESDQATKPEEAAPAEISPEEVRQLKEKAAKADEHWNQLLRISADFENYKKRAARERLEAIKFANESLLEKLVPVLDNFEMAMQAANDPKGGTVEALKTGVNMIHSQLRNVAIEAGLGEIDATDRPFDPNWHEAVSQQETTATPEGHVLQQLRRGYKLRDRLIRPATVIVARKPGAT